ncbi:MAG: hypothetical protein M3N54_11800 [Acidobacteriota bacterium]|nr:hypothetical protein [Acidobacteriota bacterium]
MGHGIPIPETPEAFVLVKTFGLEQEPLDWIAPNVPDAALNKQAKSVWAQFVCVILAAFTGVFPKVARKSAVPLPKT